MEETKELQVVKTQVTKALTAAEEIKIETELDFEVASEILAKVKTFAKLIKTKKEEITKPLNESLKNVRALFAPIEENQEEAERVIKGKMVEFQTESERKQQEVKQKLAERVERGTMKPETAVAKIENMEEVPVNRETQNSKVTFRVDVKVRITDESLIPREYLVVDMVKVKDAVLKQKLQVPGVETYEEKTPVVNLK